MGHKKYMLVRNVEVPYEQPPQDSLKWTFVHRFLFSFWWNMLPEANLRWYCQNSHFQYGRHEKMLKNLKWEFPSILTITDKKNLHLNVIV